MLTTNSGNTTKPRLESYHLGGHIGFKDTIGKTMEEKDKQVCSVHRISLVLTGIYPYQKLRCPKCKEDFDLKIEYDKRFGMSGLPLRYKDNTVDDFIVTNEEQGVLKDTIFTWCNLDTFGHKTGGGLIMLGDTRTGKTMAASIIGMAWLRNKRDVIYRTAFDVAREIKESRYHGSYERESAIIERYSMADMLIIDEIGPQFTQSKTEASFIHEITHKRYNGMRYTLFVSNLSLIELEEFVGKPVVAIFKEIGGVLCFKKNH